MSKSEGHSPDFPYTHLWVDSEGETHIKEARFSGFEKKSYAADPQYVKEGPSPTKTVLTQMDTGNFQDWHCCPQVWGHDDLQCASMLVCRCASIQATYKCMLRRLRSSLW